MYELRYYQSRTGQQPFTEWFERLRDLQARSRIQARWLEWQSAISEMPIRWAQG